MPKQKKNSQPEDELYFDIVSPSAIKEEEEEKSSDQHVYQIPIRKEKFSNIDKKKNIIKEEVIDDDQEYEEVIEEVVVEDEPEVEYEKPTKAKSKKLGKKFSWFRRNKTKTNQPKKEKNSTRRSITRISLTGSFKKKIFIIVGVSLFIVSGTFVFLTFFANSVTININAQKGSIDYAGNILIDTKSTKADYTKNVLPGRVIKISQTVSQTFDATGKVNGGAKAKGKITIYNAYNTSPQILVQNTRFESPDGLIFRLDSRVTVPGATLKNGEIVPSSIIANVTAGEIGASYNIAPVRFTIPGFKGTDRFTGFYGESKEKFTGGSDGESTAISSIDLKNAEKTISETLFEKLDNELKNQILSSEKTFKDAIVNKVSKIDFAGAKVGDSREKFTVNITGEITTIVFSKDDYTNLIRYNVEKSLEKDEELFGEFTESIISIKPDAKNNQLLVNTTIQYPTKKKIDGTEIINIIKGKNIDETKKILSNNPAIEKANIRLYPVWINTIPSVTNKIHLGID